MRNIEESKGKIFRHFKGDLYLLEDFVIHSETREKMVLYRALYGDCGLFVRPYEMFFEKNPYHPYQYHKNILKNCNGRACIWTIQTCFSH